MVRTITGFLIAAVVAMATVSCTSEKPPVADAAPTALLETAVPVEVGAVGDTIAEFQENAAIVDGVEAESQEERVKGDVLLISVEEAATSTKSEICDV